MTTEPLDDPADVVRLLLCAQAQDAPLARYSLGLRLASSSDASVRAAIDDGRIVRTHILRPTWHFVAAEDLRWVLALTSQKVDSSLASRHRQVGVDEPSIERAHGELIALLEGGRFKTAAEIGAEFAAIGPALSGATVRHLLLVAELRGLVCSGPSKGSTHRYGLVDELVPPAAPLDREAAIVRLVHRFFAGHGPALERDLRRWTTLTLTEIRTALADLGDVLESTTYDGTTFWFDPEVIEADPPRRRVALLPTFDEAHLPYKSVGLDRIAGHPRGDEPHVFAEAGGGVVLVDRADAGWWKRTVGGSGPMTIELALATGLDSDQRNLVAAAADELASFFGREARVRSPRS